MTSIPLTPLRIGTQFKEAFSSRSMTASGPATGLLSQAVENLKSSCKRLLSLTQLLPAEAQPKEAQAIQVLQEDVVKISTLQAAVRQFIATTLPQLKQAKTNLDEGKHADQIASIIGQSTAAAVALKQEIDATNSHIYATQMQIVDLSTSLAPIQIDLSKKQQQLDKDIRTKQGELDHEKASRSAYPVGLGPSFGYAYMANQERLIRLINELQTQASKLRAQLDNLTMLQQSLTAMIADFSDIITKLSGVRNAVLFIAGDDSNVIHDLKNVQGGQVMAKAYLHAAISQLETLQADAA